MKKLADHIRQANQDVEEVHVSSRKISQRFARIDAVELEAPEVETPVLEPGDG
jgi:DNA recombination protein RmuC